MISFQTAIIVKVLMLVSVLLVAGLGCNLTATHLEPTQTMPAPGNVVNVLPTSSGADKWTEFSDQNNTYIVDLPSDWLTQHSEGKDYYTDQFQPPDRKELLEVFIFDDGKPFKGGDDKYVFALSVLESLYAEKVTVVNRTVEPSGREIVSWKSQSAGFTSIFELKDQTSFIMLTIAGYGSEEDYPEVIQKIVASFAVEHEPLAETPGSFEYASVAEALEDLKAKEGVKINVSEGWTIITEADGLTMWSFTPPDHPAHPAVAKRVFHEQADGWYVDMTIHCKADKAACDQFVRDFETLNEQMRQYIEKDQLRKYLEQLQEGTSP